MNEIRTAAVSQPEAKVLGRRHATVFGERQLPDLYDFSEAFRGQQMRSQLRQKRLAQFGGDFAGRERRGAAQGFDVLFQTAMKIAGRKARISRSLPKSSAAAHLGERSVKPDAVGASFCLCPGTCP